MFVVLLGADMSDCQCRCVVANVTGVVDLPVMSLSSFPHTQRGRVASTGVEWELGDEGHDPVFVG